MMIIKEFTHELRNKELFWQVQTGEPGKWAADACSVQALNVGDATEFDSGVITVTKSNDPALGGIAIGAGVTITAPGITSLTGSDWFKLAYLLFAVTTQSSTSRRVRLIVCMRKLGFSV